MDTAVLTRRTDAIARRFAPNTLRVIAGLLWLSNAAWKVPTGFGRSAEGCGALCGYVAAGSEHRVTPVTGWMFEHLIGPHLSVFGWVTVFVEVGLAVTLLAGRFVRVAAIPPGHDDGRSKPRSTGRGYGSGPVSPSRSPIRPPASPPTRRSWSAARKPRKASTSPTRAPGVLRADRFAREHHRTPVFAKFV